MLENIYKIPDPENFQEGRIEEIKTGENVFALSKIEGRFYAFKHECPHHGANLKDGIIKGKTVICPWHHASFDLESGEMLEPPGLDSLEVFPVFGKDGEFYVDLSFGKKSGEFKEKMRSTRPVYAIIGAGSAGAAAAEALRKNDFAGRIILIGKEGTEPYDRTLFSKEFLYDNNVDDMLRIRNDSFYKGLEIERVKGSVEELDFSTNEIIFNNGEKINFDKLLIASGGIPRKPEIPGDSDNVYVLRNLTDAQRIKKAAERHSRVVIIGASFIGMECAAALTKLGLEVAVTAPENIPFERTLGKELGKSLQNMHEKKGVEFHMGTSVKNICNSSKGIKLELENGSSLKSDFAIAGIGVRPATDFIDKSILENDGSVKVDSYMRALKAPENIFAAGDIAAFPYGASERHIRVEHWRVAAQLGICAAKNMCGQNCDFNGIPLFWTDQFDLNLCYVGCVEDWDEVFIDGNLEEDFIIFYIKDKMAQAAAGKWRDADMCAIEERMKTGNMPSFEKIINGFRQWQDFNK